MSHAAAHHPPVPPENRIVGGMMACLVTRLSTTNARGDCTVYAELSEVALHGDRDPDSELVTKSRAATAERDGLNFVSAVPERF